MRLFRHTIDRSKLGRNAYANYYQYLAQVRSAGPARCWVAARLNSMWEPSHATAINTLRWSASSACLQNVLQPKVAQVAVSARALSSSDNALCLMCCVICGRSPSCAR